MEEDYQTTILKNNLRIISESIPYVRSISIGVYVLTGLQHETDSVLEGITHFIEHMVFRGTKNRTSQEIASELENVGGFIEAFTHREYVCFSIRILDEYLELSLDILSDLLSNPNFNLNEIEKEKQVIKEELKLLNESPSAIAQELFYRTIWRDYYLGKPIMGTNQSIEQMKPETIRKYWQEYFKTGRIVIAASGNINHDQLVELIKPRFNFPICNLTNISYYELTASNGFKVIKPNSSQLVHLCMGKRVMSQVNDDRYGLNIIATILGNGMSSRLFHILREKEALVYNVNCLVDLYRETGLFAIYIAVDFKNINKAIGKIKEEISWFLEEGISEEELIKAKNQHKTNIMISLEIISNRMRRIALQHINYYRVISSEEMIRKIEAVTTDNVNRLINELFRKDNFVYTAVGPEELKELSYLKDSNIIDQNLADLSILF